VLIHWPRHFAVALAGRAVEEKARVSYRASERRRSIPRWASADFSAWRLRNVLMFAAFMCVGEALDVAR